MRYVDVNLENYTLPNENLMLTAGVGGRVTGGRYELAIGFGVVGGGGKYVLGSSRRTCGTGYW